LKTDVESALKQKVEELISGDSIGLVIGYGKTHMGDGVRPLFVREASDAAGLIWNSECVHNLSTYLLKDPCLEIIRKGGRVGIVAKGCDARAIVAQIQEKQFGRDSVHIIGVVCEGVRGGGSDDEGILAKCRGCEVQTPPVYDDLIGNESEAEPIDGDSLEDIKAVESKPNAERWEFWTGELAECIKCYACREACPLCYCKECITEKSRPQWIDKSPSLRGNVAYHFIRAMHLAGRCVACGECSRACPMGIPVDMLTRQLSRKVQEGFAYRPGMDPEEEPFFLKFTDNDPEDFIK
jgi:L-lactate utilization protein LutB